MISTFHNFIFCLTSQSQGIFNGNESNMEWINNSIDKIVRVWRILIVMMITIITIKLCVTNTNVNELANNRRQQWQERTEVFQSLEAGAVVGRGKKIATMPKSSKRRELLTNSFRVAHVFSVLTFSAGYYFLCNVEIDLTLEILNSVWWRKRIHRGTDCNRESDGQRAHTVTET